MNSFEELYFTIKFRRKYDIDSLKGLNDDLRAIAIRGLKGQIILERTDK